MKIKFSNSGFSLVEVLIVLLLLSGAFIILLQALNTGKFMNTKAEVLTQQAVLLNNKIQEIRSRRFDENTTAPWSSSLGSENPTYANLSFDGANDYVSVPGTVMSTNALTFETWIYPTNVSGWRAIRNEVGWSAGDIHFQIRNGLLEFSLHGNGPTDQWFSHNFQTNIWTHIAVVYEAGNNRVRLYINGSFVQEKTYSSTRSAEIGNFQIGNWSNSRPFSGKMYDFRIWNYARTNSDIQNNMNIRLNGNETGLVGYWKFNEGSGSTLTDLSGNNNGTINGATWGSSQSSSESTISGWDDIDDFHI